MATYQIGNNVYVYYARRGNNEHLWFEVHDVDAPQPVDDDRDFVYYQRLGMLRGAAAEFECRAFEFNDMVWTVHEYSTRNGKTAIKCCGGSLGPSVWRWFHLD